MQAREFLTSLLPSAGYIIVATPTPIPNSDQVAWRNEAVETIDEALARTEEWVFEGRDTYFAMATYKELRVWNAAATNRRTNKPGKWERRTQANVFAVKCLYLDIDVKADHPKHYPTQEMGLAELQTMCTAVGLPKPTIISSGYGLHIYWPLSDFVKPEEWKPVAESLKQTCLAFGLKIDAKITADSARVLRLPGTFNFKRNAVAPVEILAVGRETPLGVFTSLFRSYADENGVSRPKVKHKIVPIIADSTFDNLGTTNDPLHFDRIVWGCPAMQTCVADRGANASEPQWRAALGLARFCEPQDVAMLAVSDGHADFDSAAMHAKVANWTYGPSKCASFWDEDNDTCEGCQFWGKITSPAQLGRDIVEAAPPTVEVATEDGVVEMKVVPIPAPYSRKAGKNGKITIVAKSEDADGNVVYEPIAPYDLYPVRILRQDNDDHIDEHTVWRMDLPNLGEIDVTIQQATLGDTTKLHKELLSKGFYVNTVEAKSTQHYMTAYIRSLSEAAARDKVYDRLGWHDDHRTFVLPQHAYFRDGSQVPHVPGRNLRNVTKNALHEEGIFDAWLDAMDFYVGPGNAAFRFFLYCSLAAPLFHMTGHKGVLIAASGDTGRGKSTVLKACASMWGDPAELMISGGQDGTTTNALYLILGTMHSLPMFWDETTERDSDEMRKFLLNISQGKGKERMKGHEHDGRVVTWETMVLSSANTDDVSRVISSGKDSDPHLMRLVSVEFDRIDRSTEAKLNADDFTRRIHAHFGHIGPRYMRYVVDNYEAIQQLVIRNMAQIDRRNRAQSQERFWTAVVACAYTAGQLAKRLGLLRYEVKEDLAWMERHLTHMRTSIAEARTSPIEIVSGFLEEHLHSTLVLSSSHSSNLNNIAVRPSRGLLIRHELDIGVIYVSRTAILDYCTEKKANFRKLEQQLLASGALLSRSTQKILGADTPYAKGQTRCWKLIESKLDPAVSTNARNAAAAEADVPVRAKGR